MATVQPLSTGYVAGDRSPGACHSARRPLVVWLMGKRRLATLPHAAAIQPLRTAHGRHSAPLFLFRSFLCIVTYCALAFRVAFPGSLTQPRMPPMVRYPTKANGRANTGDASTIARIPSHSILSLLHQARGPLLSCIYRLAPLSSCHKISIAIRGHFVVYLEHGYKEHRGKSDQTAIRVSGRLS